MAVRSTGHLTGPPGLREYLRASLLGLAQIFFLDSPWTALLFLAAIAWQGWPFALVALLGTLVATGTAYLIGEAPDQIRKGAFGFNGALVALSILVFLGGGFPWRIVVWVLLLLGAALSTLVQVAFSQLLTPFGIPASTGPFVAVSWLLLTVGGRFGATPPPPAVTLQVPLAFPALMSALFQGIGQVLFLENPISGALLLLGILVGSWQGGIMAILGAAVGVLLPALWGADPVRLEAGLFAFNPTLTAMAVGAIFSRFGSRSVGLGLVAALISLLITPGVNGLLGRYGLPGLTAPFLLTLYIWMAARHGGRRRMQP